MWRSKRQTSIWIHETRKEIHYNLVASCLPKLHSDPMFSIVLFSPLGPQTGCGAVPWTLETPRHSPPLRSRPRDALFCITSTIKCINWKLRNFLRPINARMKEAKAKRHLPYWISLRLVPCLVQLGSGLVPLRSAEFQAPVGPVVRAIL